MLTPDVYADRFAEVLRRASTRLPRDVVEALRRGRETEDRGGLARTALDTVIANAAMAEAEDAPICQDTGTPVAWIWREPPSQIPATEPGNLPNVSRI